MGGNVKFMLGYAVCILLFIIIGIPLYASIENAILGPSSYEIGALDALERVKGAAESGVNYSRYSELVSDATAKVNIVCSCSLAPLASPISDQWWVYFSSHIEARKMARLYMISCIISYQRAKQEWEFALEKDHDVRYQGEINELKALLLSNDSPVVTHIWIIQESWQQASCERSNVAGYLQKGHAARECRHGVFDIN